MQYKRMIVAVVGLLSLLFGTGLADAVHFTDVFTLNSKLLGSDTAKTATFGNEVDISGDTAVVGAMYDNVGRNLAQGSVYVYVRKKGFWVEQAKLVAADGGLKDHFGMRVAIDGDTIVVSSPSKRTPKAKYLGAVYVFTRTADHWDQQVKLEPSAPTLVESFGSSVDISGDTIIVGAMGHDNAPNDKIPQAHGAAYIYKRSNGNWSERQKLTSDALTNSGFGTTVGIHDNLAVIGTISDTNAVGAAYVFAYDGMSWKRDGKLQSGVRRSNEHFALESLAIDRGTVVVGASGAGSRLPGAAYVFTKGAAGWALNHTLKAANVEQENSFGRSVDISGDKIVVGMLQMKGPIGPQAYVFEGKLATGKFVWTQSQMLISPETFIGDTFAHCVGISGNHIVIGASSHDSDPTRKTRGAAYIFEAPKPGSSG